MEQTGYQPLGDYTFPENIKKIIQENGTREDLDPGVIFQYPGENSEYLYYIEQGKVLLGIWSDKGEERLIEILGPNNFCASASVLASVPDRIFLQTDAPTVLYKINRDKIKQLIHDSEEFRDMIIQYVSTILIRMTTLIEGITFLNCKERIYQLLKVSMNPNISADKVWHPIRYPYSKMDIARIVGASRPTTSRLFGELCAEGLIREINHTIQVRE